MASGQKTLHQIDASLRHARAAVGEAASLSQRASDALTRMRAKEAEAFGQIARDRLDLIEGGGGGTLGYIDRQVEKNLAAHALEEAASAKRLAASEAQLQALEDARRTQEKSVNTAVDDYDKAVAASEAALLKDPDYTAQLSHVAEAEAMVLRGEEKLKIARQDEAAKGKPYREDEFFNYLTTRGYGTKHHKGWFLTKALDGWVAGLTKYRDAAENYRRLTDIPKRLDAHVDYLQAQVLAAQGELQAVEAARLEADGVNAARQKSLDAQAKLEKIDADIAAHEAQHQTVLDAHIAISHGQSGAMAEAMSALTEALQKMDRRSLSRLASQTQTVTDDRAIERLREISESVRDLSDDKAEADRLLRKYQRSQTELESVRKRFKSRRYDAPSSTFNNGDLILGILGQVVAGAVDGDDLWKALSRAQRTLKRYSDIDFGGIDWEDGFRLPRGTSGGWGGGSSRNSSKRRTSLPRMPRQSLPRGRSGGGGFGGKSRGGFKTGGGF